MIATGRQDDGYRTTQPVQTGQSRLSPGPESVHILFNPGGVKMH
jgi:hypothetical protein